MHHQKPAVDKRRTYVSTERRGLAMTRGRSVLALKLQELRYAYKAQS